ncbi:Lysosomal amino acid transporter 1 [Sphaceloma murrayae]|uniref:Lysosomal amino acid transporter 1 n=1 Tax=Sphaceloma murrayae TaxID=2082308 RepID=A0A2K1QW40_9PEZI|nr:Lysosomal amino acid transporter 1 [Sphaceloma murrayae]
MSWHLSSLTQPQLPPHCHPTSDFLHRWSATFHVCVPTPLAFLSSALGTLSIVSWLFAQLPQIYKNYALASTTGLSIYFLVEWCLGDLSNLLGAIFTNQASWQIIVAGYYCFVDFVLVFQWVWYERLRHGWTIRSVWVKSGDNDNTGGPPSPIERLVSSGVSISDTSSIRSDRTTNKTPARDIAYSNSPRDGPGWRMPRFTPDEKERSSSFSPSGRPYLNANASSSFGPSPRTVILVACCITLVRASPIAPTDQFITTTTSPSTSILSAGTILSWSSTALYLLSRLPQLYKNYKRQSTAGLSPHLFMAAFFGNLFYSSSILTNPCAWFDFQPYGGGGWAGPDGSVRRDWVLRALPFWLGAAGVLILDGAMGIQFLMYGEAGKVVVAEEVDSKRKRRRWKRVSGYMRGWVPSFTDGKIKIRGTEGRRLLGGEAQGRAGRDGYGTTS